VIPTPSLLKVSDINKTFINRNGLFRRQSVDVLKHISFTLEQGETLAILGETGSGKSTLAKVLAGMVQPTSGTIEVNGEEIQFYDTQKRCKLIRMMFQDPNSSLNPRLRVGRILEAPLRLNTELTEEERASTVIDTLRMVGLLPDHALFYPQMISLGQKQRIALARALILNPSIIVADEAFSMLDVSMRSQMVNLLLKLQERLGLSYVIVANDLGLIRHISDKVLVMHQGEMVESGTTHDVFSNPQHDITQRLIQSHGHEYRRKTK